MLATFDKFNKKRIPSFILCNPDGSQLYSMAGITDRNVTLRYNDISEVSFKAYSKTNGKITPYFKFLQSTRRVLIKNVGVFVITKVVEVDEGEYKVKTVQCKSLEYTMADEGVSLEEGTYKFYDPIDNSKPTIMSIFLEHMVGWKIGNIDSNLWNMYRTFSVVDKRLYEFMMTDVESAYECIFIFDTIAKTISAISTNAAIKKTNISISTRNLIKEITKDELSEDVVTGLTIFGADDLSIRSVNPLGGSVIYNFSYYKNTEWMSQDLIGAISSWENKQETSKAPFKNNLSLIKAKNGELITYKTQLTKLEGQLKEFEGVKAVRIEQGLDLTSINSEISAKQSEIELKKTQIMNKEKEIDTLKNSNSAIVKNLSFENNFTSAQFETLKNFMKIGTYQNDTFVVTDSMDETQKQTMIEELYDMGVDKLSKVSSPKYTFNINAVNFLELIKYQKFIKEIELGCQITVGLGDMQFVYPNLLEMVFSYDNVEELRLGFSNGLSMNNGANTIGDILKEANSISNDVSFNKGKWGEGIKANTKLNDYMNSSLNASLQDIVNSDYQDIVIDGSGIRCRRFDPEVGDYDNEMMWITGKSLVFSDDQFRTAKTALGMITLPDGSKGYGLNTEILMGKLTVTSQLIIENEGGTFLVDSNGVTLVNAKLIIRNEDGTETTVDKELGDLENQINQAITDGSSNLGNAITDLENKINSAKNEAATNLGNAVTNLSNDIKSVQDGVVEIFYDTIAPNNPKHGDLWFNTSEQGKNKVSRYNTDITPATWESVQDQDIIDALEKAGTAQATADKKIKTFYQDNTPTSGMDEGDLWFDTNDSNRQYRFDKTSGRWVDVRDNSINEAVQEALDRKVTTYYDPTPPRNPIVGDLWFDTSVVNGSTKNKLHRWSGVSWIPITDKEIVDAIDKAQNAQDTADKKIVTFYQASQPTDGSVGDLWIDTDDGNRMHRFDGNKWVDIHDNRLDSIASDLAGAISSITNLDKYVKDNILDTFYQSTPPSNAKYGDLWLNTSSGKLYRRNNIQNSSNWQELWDTVTDKDLQESVQNAENIANGKIRTFYQPVQPTSTQEYTLGEGDLWFNTAKKNELKVYHLLSQTWKDATYQGINDEINNALKKKITTYYSTTPPSNPTDGDLWFDITLVAGKPKNELSRYNGNVWIKVVDQNIINAIENAQDTADGKIVTFMQPTQPTGGTSGDLWFDTDDNNKMYRHDGIRWIPCEYTGMTQTVADELKGMLDKIVQIEDIADGKVDIFYSETAPSNPKQGDLWVDITLNENKRPKNKMYRYDNNTWKLVQDESVQDVIDNLGKLEIVIDGKVTTYYGSVSQLPPVAELKEGDLWVDTSNNNKLMIRHGMAWVDVSIGGEDLNQDVLQALAKAQEALTKAEQALALEDKMIDTYYQATQPTSVKIGDMWINTSTGRVNIYTSSGWKESQDQSIKDAIDDARKALGVAGAKNTIHFQDIAPSIGVKGDMWVDTNDENKIYVHNGSTWVLTMEQVIEDANTILSGIYDGFFDHDKQFWSTEYKGKDIPSATVGEIVNDGISGSRAWKLEGEHTLYSKNAIPLETNRTLKFIFKAKQIVHARTGHKLSVYKNQTLAQMKTKNLYDLGWYLSNEMQVKAGIVCLDKNYNVVGSPKYFVVNGDIVKPVDGWVTFVGEIYGVGTDLNQYHPNAVYMRPVFTVNYPKGSGTVLVDSYVIKDITEAKDLDTKFTAQLGSALDTMTGMIDDVNGRVDGVVEIFYQGIQPTTAKSGDIWYNTSKKNEAKMFNGTTWDSIKDEDVLTALDQAQNAQNTADGKITTYYQPEPPYDGQIINGQAITLSSGDLWFDTNDKNALYVYDPKYPSKWKSAKYEGINDATQNALNDKITTYYSETEPSDHNIGDLWFDISLVDGRPKNKLYRWNGVSWKEVTDQELINSIGIAQDTANGKNTTYIHTEQPVNNMVLDGKKVKLSKGDLWIDSNDGNKLYRWNGTSWIDIHDKRLDEISKTLSDAITNIYTDMSEMEQAIKDGEIIIWYEDNDPALNPENNVKEGDLWFDTNDNKASYLRRGGVWESIKDEQIQDALDKANQAQTTADGKIKTYWQNELPTGLTANDTGDLWVDTNDNNRMYRWNGSEWIDIHDKTIDKVSSDLSNAINSIYTEIGNLEQAVIDGEINIFYQGTTPVTAKEGDIWYNTSKKNEASLYNAGKWVSIKDEDVLTALDQAQNAQTTADGKIKTYWQNEPPTGLTKTDLGDLWFDTDDGNKMYIWVQEGSVLKWKLNRDSTLDKVDNVLTVDGNITTSKLEGTLDAHTNNILSGANMQVVMDKDGIWAMNNADKSKATRVVAMNENGIVMAKERVGGNLNWRTAISADGINADEINTGTLRALNIFGCNILSSTDKCKVTIDPFIGIKIEKKTGTTWSDTLVIDTDGDAVFKGKLVGNEISINNNFTVDRSGNVIAKSIKISGAGSELDAKDMVVRSLVVGENVSMGENASISWNNISEKPQDLAYKKDIHTDSQIRSLSNSEAQTLLSGTYGITYTTIGRTSISSPNISGGTITGTNIVGGAIRQESDSSVYHDLNISHGRVQFYNGGINTGNIVSTATYDSVLQRNVDKIFIEGVNALKLGSLYGDISVTPRNGDYVNGRIYLDGKVIVKGGNIVDENNRPISATGNVVAVFGA